MRWLSAGVAVAVTLCFGGLLFALISNGSENVTATKGATTPDPAFALGQSTPPRPRRADLTLPNLTQADLLADRAVSVRVTSARAGSARIGASYEAADGRFVGAGSRRVTLKRGANSIAVPLSSAARGALAGCAPRRLQAEITGGETVVRSQRTTGRLFLHPPQCAQFFPADSAWNTPLPADMPLDEASDLIVSELQRQVKVASPTINVGRFSTPIYTVPRSQKRVRYVLDRDESFAERVKRKFAPGVPIPEGARPSRGSDGQMTIWQPSTDTLWELYKAKLVGGVWHGRWGAVMRNVSKNPGAFPRESSGAYISTTASGLPLVGGLITLADLERGRIDHALELAVPHARAGVTSHPARITDGNASGAESIPEGARFRLAADLDLQALDLSPLARMLAEAAQRYGIIVNDQAGAMSFRGQDPAGGSDAWQRALDGDAAFEVAARFPWHKLELTEMVLAGGSVRRKYALPGGSQTSASPKQRVPPACQLYAFCELFR